ncbi:MAG: hypothetical protein AAGA56_19455 [Myxococcota bacterium]
MTSPPLVQASGARRHRTRWWLSALLVLLGTMAWSASCTPGFDPVSKINTLRVLSVTIDEPYIVMDLEGSPDDEREVTFRMTVVDTGLNDSGGSRPLQILWLGGCHNPLGDQFALCFDEIAAGLEGFNAETFNESGAGLGEATELSSGVVVQADLASSEISRGVPDAIEFTTVLPEDLIRSRERPSSGPYYGISYVFFAACAGTLAPAPLETPGGGQSFDFPLDCLDAEGNSLGSDSFLIGYTQVYAFEDRRDNENPPIDGIAFRFGDEGDFFGIAEGMTDIPTLPACPVDEDARREAGCGANATEDCQTVQFQALIGDVAEFDAAETDLDGNALRETVWVTYFADGGELEPSLSLVSDAVQGYQSEFETEWIPPDVPGVYSIWAVVRDQRGGSNVVQRFVNVE